MIKFLNDPSMKNARRAFEAYGHEKQWDDAVDYKFRSDGCYLVLLFPSQGYFYFVDMASDGNDNWEIQNDCSDYVTMEAFKKARIVPECDWLENITFIDVTN